MKRYFMKSTWGSDDPTRAAMIFGHGNALARAGNEVRMFLLGEATTLVRPKVRESLIPVGWPPVSEQWLETLQLGIRIEICGACSRARGISSEDIEAAGAFPGSPETFVPSCEWADHIISEG
ncbi:DsrE family protein [Acidithiobacillus sp. M4-SHS-6]|uniref:DsrE family protein n=1 Tax=Acidithiobacillus sp. M4-SHS-6 TaxID=3383024 RepID=UPI0039BEB671